jgi:hypothetical protein
LAGDRRAAGAEDHRVVPRRHPHPVHGRHGAPGRLGAGGAAELVQTHPRGPAGALGPAGLDHGGQGGGPERGLVGLGLGHGARGDGHALLEHGQVPTDHQAEAGESAGRPPEPPQTLVGAEDPEGRLEQLPARPPQALVAQLEEGRVVIVVQAAPLGAGSGQAVELGVAHGGPAGLGPGPLHGGRRDVARLGAEAHAVAVRPGQDHLHAHPEGLDRRGLLEPVAGDVGGVVEPRREHPVGGDEDLGLPQPGPGPEPGEALGRRPGEAAGHRTGTRERAPGLTSGAGSRRRSGSP